jgi:hypothetical protein
MVKTRKWQVELAFAGKKIPCEMHDREMVWSVHTSQVDSLPPVGTTASCRLGKRVPQPVDQSASFNRISNQTLPVIILG